MIPSRCKCISSPTVYVGAIIVVVDDVVLGELDRCCIWWWRVDMEVSTINWIIVVVFCCHVTVTCDNSIVSESGKQAAEKGKSLVYENQLELLNISLAYSKSSKLMVIIRLGRVVGFARSAVVSFITVQLENVTFFYSISAASQQSELRFKFSSSIQTCDHTTDVVWHFL